MAAPSRPSAAAQADLQRDPLMFAVVALGLAQITAWGTSYYCLGVLANPIANDTGWSLGFIYFGFTAALLTMGAVSPWTGRAIDRYGARCIMALGTIVVSLGLTALAWANSQGMYLVAWLVLGAGMRLCLYDAAFAALVQVVPTRGRLAISYVTLFGAFASTVFWVIGHFLDETLGWRPTLMLFAAINLAICLPLNWLGLSRREAQECQEDTRRAPTGFEQAPLAGGTRRVAMCLFAVVMSLNGFVFGVVTVQLIPLLEAAGLATAAAVWVASMKGFAQFGGRVVEIVFGRSLRAMTVGRIAIGILPLSFLLLMLEPGYLPAVIGFTVLMGASQGVITIVRGALPLALFGTAGYGAVLGLLATPILIVNAASPTLFALIVDGWGWRVAQLVLLASASASWLAIEAMARWHARATSADNART